MMNTGKCTKTKGKIAPCERAEMDFKQMEKRLKRKGFKPKQIKNIIKLIKMGGREEWHSWSDSKKKKSEYSCTITITFEAEKP